MLAGAHTRTKHPETSALKIQVVAIGAKAPEWVRLGFAEYAKRLPQEFAFELIEIPAPKHRADAARSERTEGEKMLARIAASDWVVALDEGGRQVDSQGMAARLDAWRMQGANITLLIGGADGLASAVKQRANETLSLSRLTFPHYQVRVLLAEALYRAWTISTGHPYHRA